MLEPEASRRQVDQQGLLGKRRLLNVEEHKMKLRSKFRRFHSKEAQVERPIAFCSPAFAAHKRRHVNQQCLFNMMLSTQTITVWISDFGKRELCWQLQAP